MSSSDSKSQELHVEAYKILVSMLQSDDSLFWRRNDVLIAINGGMLTVIGLLQSFQSPVFTKNINAISIAICVIGVVVCLLWMLIAKRSEAFYNHWYEQLKQIENQYLTPIRIFNIADEYFTKGEIKLGEDHFKLDFLSRFLRMFAAMQILAGIFSLVWLVLGIYIII